MSSSMDFTNLYLNMYMFLVNSIPFGGCAEKVSISQNNTGLIGNNDISLTCSFIIFGWEYLTRVELFAKNKTEEFDAVKPIVIFQPDEAARLLSSGNYLNGRVTLTNLTSMSTNATLTFHVLKCEDEKDYICQCYFNDMEEVSLSIEKSPSTRILVQTTSSKPDPITSRIALSTKTQIQKFSSPIYKPSMSTNKDDMSTLLTSSTNTITTTHLYSTEKLPFVFREGDTVMFTCVGNIGNPPGKLIWQLTFPHGKKPTTYSNETTYKEEIPSQCVFKGTSHLKVKLYAEDRKAKIRCFEESQENVPGMYLETKPLDVHFVVRSINIHVQPKQKRYDNMVDKITLTCNGTGNPKPNFIWFKESNKRNILSRTHIYVIEDVVHNNNGVYICEATNLIDGKEYRKTNSVDICIVDDLPTSIKSEPWKMSTVLEPAAIIVACAIVIIIPIYCIVKRGYCSRSNRHDAVQTGHVTCKAVTAITFVKDHDTYEDLIESDQRAIYDVVNTQANLESELTNIHTSIPTDNVVYDNVSMQSSINSGRHNKQL